MSDPRDPRPGRWPLVLYALVPGVALGLAMGCTEPPSYALRWTLVDESGIGEPDQAAPLTSVKQCSDVGVSKIRVTTLRLDNSVADRREYPCFPGAFERGELVEGPTLEPGEYKLEVEGLRRSGEAWTCVEDPDEPEPGPCVAYAEGTVTVVEGELPAVEFVLLSPPECDDGIDNDGDGRVDGKDPACILDPDGPERTDDSVALFQLRVSFLDSPAVFPVDVSVATLRLAIDGELLADVPVQQLDFSQWPFRLPLFSASLELGTYEFSITALDQSGVELTVPLVREFPVPFTDFGEAFNFTGEDFLEPIVEPISVSLGLLLNPDDLTGPACSLAGIVDGAPVTIERTWFRVTDEAEQPLDAATLNLTGSSSEGPLMPVEEAEGWISFACPTSSVVSSPLLWGSYAIQIESRIGESVCFETVEPLDLAPLGNSGAQSLTLQRVVDDMGAPPPGCEECVVTSDCPGQQCVAGICKDN